MVKSKKRNKTWLTEKEFNNIKLIADHMPTVSDVHLGEIVERSNVTVGRIRKCANWEEYRKTLLDSHPKAKPELVMTEETKDITLPTAHTLRPVPDNGMYQVLDRAVQAINRQADAMERLADAWESQPNKKGLFR